MNTNIINLWKNFWNYLMFFLSLNNFNYSTDSNGSKFNIGSIGRNLQRLIPFTLLTGSSLINQSSSYSNGMLSNPALVNNSNTLTVSSNEVHNFSEIHQFSEPNYYQLNTHYSTQPLYNPINPSNQTIAMVNSMIAVNSLNNQYSSSLGSVYNEQNQQDNNWKNDLKNIGNNMDNNIEIQENNNNEVILVDPTHQNINEYFQSDEEFEMKKQSLINQIQELDNVYEDNNNAEKINENDFDEDNENFHKNQDEFFKEEKENKENNNSYSALNNTFALVKIFEIITLFKAYEKFQWFNNKYNSLKNTNENNYNNPSSSMIFGSINNVLKSFASPFFNDFDSSNDSLDNKLQLENGALHTLVVAVKNTVDFSKNLFKNLVN